MKDATLAYLLVAFTFGVVGLSGLVSGRSEMLAFVILAGIFGLLGYSSWTQEQQQKKNPDSPQAED